MKLKFGAFFLIGALGDYINCLYIVEMSLCTVDTNCQNQALTTAPKAIIYGKVNELIETQGQKL